MIGILVRGNNHFIVSGPLPDEATALALVRYWSIIQIGEAKSSSFGQWQICSKEFRENLEWAVIVPETVKFLRKWRNYFENFPLAACTSGDCLPVAGKLQEEPQHRAIVKFADELKLKPSVSAGVSVTQEC
jgi:hypothetical protein